MQGKKDSIPMEKVTIRLYKGDKETLNELLPNLGYNQVIRTLVRNLITKLEAQGNSNPAKNIEVNINI